MNGSDHQKNIFNVEEYSVHSTRRTKAMFLYRRGVKLGTISKALGHKNLTATILYLGIEEQEVVDDWNPNLSIVSSSVDTSLQSQG